MPRWSVNSTISWVLVAIILLLMYVTMFWPQARKLRQRRQMLAAVRKGDRIVTVGGIYGTVVGVADSTVTVRVADKVEIVLTKSGIGQVLAPTDRKRDASS